VTVRAHGGSVEPEGHATDAVRQVEYWYRDCVDGFVREGMARPASVAAGVPGRPQEINAPVLAYAHEQAWRHAVVRAQRSSEPGDWAALTVVHEAASYEHLLGWTAATYGVSEDEIRSVQTTRGYRHHSR